MAGQRYTSLLLIINGVHNWGSSSEPFLHQLVEHLDLDPLGIPVRFVFISQLRQSLRATVAKRKIVIIDEGVYYLALLFI